ncbi:D-alanyl-D-alanine carboxypeptidase/D-alanyl-D-alanine endopeptidase [Streptomyces zingiberis]|uniref:D-alanyl-D-alanine carboxypeptidase/D-alanyl-D-alanine endopeptidase n=1 Tax=Streptomyces zingiberis TaxID=2053010 RepID=UPI0035D50870
MPETGWWRSRRPAGGWWDLPAWQLAAVSAVLGLALTAGAVTAAGPWDSGQRTAERARAAHGERGGGERHGGGLPGQPGGGVAPQATAVLAALDATAGSAPPPTATGLGDALTPLLDDPALGSRSSVAVADALTGRIVHGTRRNAPVVPASTIKIATAVAALSALGPDHRLTTEVVTGGGGEGDGKGGDGKGGDGTEEAGGKDAGEDGKSAARKRAAAGDGTIVLVGGGDPTLTARAARGPGNPASLRDLADRTARALKEKDTRAVRLAYDTSRWSGKARHSIGVNENIAPVVPLSTDMGRLDDSVRGPAPRSADPARDAAGTFAGLLRERGITVSGKPRQATAGAGAERLAAVRSMPVAALVERALTNSDNDIAEALARETAVAAGVPASFSGAGRAVRDRLAGLDLPLRGARFADGSGLDRDDRLTAALLAQLLVRSADPARPELRPVLTGLPVAGFSGTLRGRYTDASAGTGMVRAKTGTLTGVNTLAGTVVDADGRLLSFAFVTNGSTDPHGAQTALDRLASALANCGCR